MPLNLRKKVCANTDISQLILASSHQIKVAKTRASRSSVPATRKILGADNVFGTEVPTNAPTHLKNVDGRKVKLGFDFRTKLPTIAEARAKYVKDYNIRLDEHGNPKGIRANIEEDDTRWKAFTEGRRMAYDYLMRAKNDSAYAEYLAQADQLDIADRISRKKMEMKRNLKRSAPVDEIPVAKSKLLCQMRRSSRLHQLTAH